MGHAGVGERNTRVAEEAVNVRASVCAQPPDNNTTAAVTNTRSTGTPPPRAPVHLLVCVKDVWVALPNVNHPLWQRDLTRVTHVATSSMEGHNSLDLEPSSSTPVQQQGFVN